MKYSTLFVLLAVGTAIVFSIHAAVERTGATQAHLPLLTANTAATNMTEQQVLSLMDEAPKTNLAAQLWQRMAAQNALATQAADISVEVRVLEHLRGGRTNDAISELERKLDGDLSWLGYGLDVMDPATRREAGVVYLKALQRAKDYRIKFPRSTGVPQLDNGVEHAFSHLDE